MFLIACLDKREYIDPYKMDGRRQFSNIAKEPYSPFVALGILTANDQSLGVSNSTWAIDGTSPVGRWANSRITTVFETEHSQSLYLEIRASFLDITLLVMSSMQRSGYPLRHNADAAGFQWILSRTYSVQTRVADCQWLTPQMLPDCAHYLEQCDQGNNASGRGKKFRRWLLRKRLHPATRTMLGGLPRKRSPRSVRQPAKKATRRIHLFRSS